MITPQEAIDLREKIKYIDSKISNFKKEISHINKLDDKTIEKIRLQITELKIKECVKYI